MATIRWCSIFPKWDSYQPLKEAHIYIYIYIYIARKNRDGLVETTAHPEELRLLRRRRLLWLRSLPWSHGGKDDIGALHFLVGTWWNMLDIWLDIWLEWLEYDGIWKCKDSTYDVRFCQHLYSLGPNDGGCGSCCGAGHGLGDPRHAPCLVMAQSILNGLNRIISRQIISDCTVVNQFIIWYNLPCCATHNFDRSTVICSMMWWKDLFLRGWVCQHDTLQTKPL